MKKLLATLVLSLTALTSVAATSDDGIETEDRVYFNPEKSAWVFKDGFVIDAPYVSFWTGLNKPLQKPKAKSSKFLLTFDCRKQKFRFEAAMEYSLPDNKGKKLREDFNVSRWLPIEPDTIFNEMVKAACR